MFLQQSQVSEGCVLERARLYQELRVFLASRNVVEVDVPTLGSHTVTDPHVDSLSVVGAGPPVSTNSPVRFLQTSPEYYLKRFLATPLGHQVGSAYYLGKAYRDDPDSRRHRAEFTLLEWYRSGLDDRGLMDEMVALFQQLSPGIAIEKMSYQSLFEQHFGINPHAVNEPMLRKVVRQHMDISWAEDSVSVWLDLLFSHVIEPTLQDTLTFVYDYPAVQSALSRVVKNAHGYHVARRFEVFWRGMELANGYWELTCPLEQRTRFTANQVQRQQLNKPVPEIDEAFMAALDHGIPECAGVAMGLDRLLMCLLGVSDIADVMTPFYRPE